MATTKDYALAGEGVEKVGELIVEGIHKQVGKDAREYADEIGQWLRERPVTAVLAGFGIGLVLGRLMFGR